MAHIFHKKKGLGWVPNANEIDTNNVRCTWSTQAPMLEDTTQPIFHLLTLGVVLDKSGVGLGLQGYSDTNMLVFPMRNRCVGCLSQRENQMRMVLHCIEI